MAKDRNRFWDVVKGASIIAVILIHTTSRWTVGGAVWRQFINFPVAMFFFLSAYFCHYDGSIRDFIGKRAKRLLVPYAVFSIFYALLDIRFKAHQAVAIDAHAVMESMLSFSLGWGYFVLALFQFMCLYPWLKIKGIRWLAWFAGICFAVSLGYCWCAETVLREWGLYRRMMPFVLFLPWTPMFVLGMAAKRVCHLPRMRWTMMGCLAFFAVSIAEGVLYMKIGMSELAFSQTKLGSIGFSFFLALVLCSLNLAGEGDGKSSVFADVFARFGRYSFFIYLSHRFVLMILRGVFHAMPTDVFFCFLPCAAIVVVYAVIRLMDAMPSAVRKQLWVVGL